MTGDLPSDFAAERERLLDPAHDEHEDIIGYLQDYPDPASVSYLKSVIALKRKRKASAALNPTQKSCASCL